MADRIQIRRDTAENWTSANPILAQGEFGVETDTLKLKIGDGVTYWRDLRYYHSGSPYIPGTGIDITDFRISNTGIVTLTTGSANGTIKANNTDIAVKGLGSAAYTSSTDYATSEQGVKADTAVQPGDLATVATSGDYDDLLNKPTIPTVNNATLTIQKNGTTVNTFTANASSNVTANITVPTKISDLTNDSNFANTDLSNLTSTGANIGNWSSNVTNCITEIPQDIQLELAANGTLTLKADSKLYIPNGTNTFTPKTFASDVTRTAGIGMPCFEVALFDKSTLGFVQTFEIPVAKACSGTTDTLAGQAQHLWYDTTNNLIKYYGSDGTTNSYYAAFPHAIVSGNNSSITSIDQIFNGFGYIGSTIFALPGVRGLIPNGRNADGSLNNILTTPATTVKTSTAVSGNTGRKTMTITSSGVIDRPGGLEYNERENRNYNFGSRSGQCACGHFTVGSDYKITNFVVKTAFHAVDYNDSNYIANCAMLSDRYVDLTLPASGGTITAQADGFLYLNKVSSASGQRIKLNNTNGTEASVSSWSSENGQSLDLLLLVSKGDVIRINYNAGGTTNYFRFIYANGAK